MEIDSPVRASGLSSVVIPANRDHQDPTSEEEITLHDEQLDSPQRKRKHRTDSESSHGYEVNVREVKKQPEGFIKPSSDGELSDTEPKRQKREDRSKDARKEHKEEEDQYVGARYWGGRPRQLHRDDPNRGRPYPNDSPPPRDRPAKEEPPRIRKPQVDETISTRTGGAYIPPAKLRMMQQAITDKNSMAYQRLAWEALKKSIHGLINKINTSNIKHIIRGLFKENVVRGRGMLCRSIMQAQAASPTFTHVYASLVSIINTKFPNIGELLLKRLVLQFRRGFRRNEKVSCMAATRFIAHLVNQQVAHEILALELLTLLLENPTDDSVEVAVGFLKESGMKLTELSPRGIHAVFERLRHVLHEAPLDKRVKYMIEVMFQVRKDGFKDFPSVVNELDLVEEQEQFTHLMSLEDPTDPETMLDVFKLDPEFEANEEKYKGVMQDILDESSDDDEDKSGSESESSSEEDEEEKLEKETAILDQTETNLVNLRRTIYLTIQSSLDHNETVHKLMKMQLKPGQEVELCHMILDCCAQQRTYEKFFGLTAQRFCQLNGLYLGPFQQLFKDTYDTIHRLETNRLRNVAKFFAHLLFSDSISWEVFGNIRLNEEETSSSSRIFIKILFQELAEYLGLAKLNERLKDPTLQVGFEGMFPRDDPRNTRFAINFFTSIGLGGLTDELREHLRTAPRVNPTDVTGLSATALEILKQAGDESSASDSDSSSNSSSNSDSEASKKGRKKKKRKAKERLSRAVERQKVSPEPSGNKETRREREGVKRRDRREESAQKPSPEPSGNKENRREREGVKRRDRREESAQKPERETRRGGGMKEEVSRQSGRTPYEDRDDSRRLEEGRGSGRDRPRKTDDRDDRDGYRTERKRSPRPPSDHSRRHRRDDSRHEEHYRRRH